MKKQVLVALACALVTSQTYSMSPQQRAAQLRQDEASRKSIKANIVNISKADNMGQVGQLRIETQQLINSVPRGQKEFQSKLDNAVTQGEKNVLESINRKLKNVTVGAQAPQQDNTDYGRLLAVTNFANQQRQLVQRYATELRFISSVDIYSMQSINFKVVAAEEYFTVNDDTLDELSKAIRASVQVLVNDAVNKISKDFVNKYQTSLRLELSAASNAIIAYKNMLIRTYVKPLLGKDDRNAKSFKNSVLRDTYKLMRAAENKNLITEADMNNFKAQYNDLLKK